MRASDPSAFEDTPADGFIGRRLGRYVLCRELGVGGMARVHLARSEGEAGFQKLVALKSIHPHLAGEQTFVDMFLDEARLASRINHRNVCGVFDFGRAEGTYYLAMEYLVGEPLSRIVDVILREAPREEIDALPLYAARLVADAAEGLHAAHELRDDDGELLGVVHRDVSPQNLFVTFDGTTKVVDFGCAKAAQRISHTDTGILKGKVAYAAPEQMKQMVVDRRADVWSLGVCLWELLTLDRLFARETDIASAMAVLDDPIPFASEGRPWVPNELAIIARKALSRDPNERYPTARELGRDLRGWLARSGHAVDSAEVADWMDRLFAGGHERQLALVEEAKSAIVPQTSLPPVRAPRGDPSTGRAPRISLEDAHTDRQRSGSSGVWFVLLLVLLVGGGGVWAWRTGKIDAWLRGAGVSEQEPAVSTAPAPEPEPPLPAPAGTTDDMTFDDPTELVAPIPAASEATVAVDPSTAPVVPAPEAEPPSTTVAFARNAVRTRPDPPETAPEPPPPSPEPAVPATGSVRVEASGGWSEVYEGDRHLGRTPLTVQLSAGPHTLRLLPFGREPGSSQTVRVPPGTEITVRVAIRDAREPDPEPTPPEPTISPPRP